MMSSIVRPIIRPLVVSTPSGIVIDPHGGGSNHPYVDMILALNPLAYYRLDETGGASAVDLTEQQSDLTYNNFAGSAYGQTAALVGSGAGTSILTDGVDDYVAGDGSFAASQDNLTVNLWVKLPSSNPDWSTPFALRSTFNSEKIRFQKSANNAHLTAVYENATDTETINHIGTWDDTWRMLTLTFDSAATQIVYYVNGSRIGSRTNAAFSTPSVVTDMTIGSFSSGSSKVNGGFDEVSIHNRTFTDAEVANLYAASGRE